MARRQFLWIHPKGAGCYYAAANNIAAGPGQKGTLMIWQWPFWRGDTAERYWRLRVDDGNYMECRLLRSLRVASQGNVWTVDVERNTTVYDWDLMVYTWDFTVPGGGRLRAYWNGSPVGNPVNNANAPVGNPQRLSLGPDLNVETKGSFLIYSLAVWNGVMTPEQVMALWREGHRYIPRATDGTGQMTLLATFNERYNADVAAGDGTFRAEGAPDRYCLVNDGAVEWRRRSFLIGTPRHDLSADDRVPLSVPCPIITDFGRIGYVNETNYANYGELQVLAGYGSNRAVGARLQGRPVFEGDGIQAPGTLRQRLHLPMDGTPAGRFVRLGPVDYLHYPTRAESVYDGWGSGRRFVVVSDVGNTPSQFKTDLDGRFPDDYWNGAYVVLLTGNCGGRRLRVADYVAATRVIVLESALPAVPEGGAVGIVDHRARLQGVSSRNDLTRGMRVPEMNMDAWLWEFHGTDRYFTELEYQYSGPNESEWYVPNCLRYERGRTALLDGVPTGSEDSWAIYGKPATHETNTLSCRVLVERVEIDGPGTYQVLRRDVNGVGPELADNFMLRGWDGHSTKVWRARDVVRTTARPTKITTPALVKSDLTAPGTWRDTAGPYPIPVEYSADGQRVVAAIVGTDPGGVSRIGYIVGEWDAGTGRIRWTDEPAPPGKSNPFMLYRDLRPARNGDGQLLGSDLIAILQTEDGKWSLVYNSQTANPDHLMTYLLSGAEDRWSFSRAEHWWHGNPVVPILGGPDLVSADGSGYGTWANRDAGWYIVRNPYTHNPERRYVGFARGKSINHRSTAYSWDLRPVIGIRGTDLRAMTPLPHGNTVTPLAGPLIHIHEVAVLDQGDCIGLYSDTAIAFSSGVFAFVSEDGVHFQPYASDGEWIARSELPGEPSRLYPGRPFRLGDRRVYYYYGGSGFVNFAWCRLDGECWYQLGTGKTQGMFETSSIARPRDGWGRLMLNASPRNGSVQVEVLDGETEEVIPGYSGPQFSGVVDSVSQEARWGAVGLEDLTTETIRLRFRLEAATGSSPRVYSWRILDPSPPAPVVVGHWPTGTGVDPGATVSVIFSVAMDRESTEGAFTLSPEVEGGFLWSDGDKRLTFVPDGELAEGTEYTVRVTAEAKSVEGTPLGLEQGWGFRTLHRPVATGLRVEGAIDPAEVVNPRPEFSWEYADAEGLAQTAYQVLVSSDRERLEAREGDVWDSGVVLSGEPRVVYGGPELASRRVYYWRVRVRNAQGVWSEEW